MAQGLFVIPEPSIIQKVASVIGLDGQKMSKSYNNTIGLFEDEKPLRKKIMSIVTDSTPVEAPKDPANIEHRRTLPALVTGEADVEKMEADFRAGGMGLRRFQEAPV